MSQYIFIEENEYNSLKRDAKTAQLLIDIIDQECEEIYPDVEYWCDVGTNATVALIQIEQMSKDLKKHLPKRKKWF